MKALQEPDHPELSNQLFAAYSKVEDAKSLASVIGEDELSDMDKKYIKFGRAFEEKFLTQGKNENRTIDDTLNLGWSFWVMLPKSELDRVSDKTLEKYYRPVEDEESIILRGGISDGKDVSTYKR